jgi:hypothetical protein
MSDEWKTDFSIDDDEFAYATVTHNGVARKHNLGPAGGAVVAAMAWLEYGDAERSPPPDVTLRMAADLLYYGDLGADHDALAAELQKIADGIEAKAEPVTA